MSARRLTGPLLLRHALLALLALGLLLQAQAGVLRQLLGAAHWHQQPVQAQHGWEGHTSTEVAPQPTDTFGLMARLQAWRQGVQARSPLAAGHPRTVLHAADDGHHHGTLARHHHPPQDAGMVVVDAAGAGADPAGDSLAGSLLQPLGLAAPLRCPAAAVAGARWPCGHRAQWQDAGLRPPEHPPRA